MKLSQPGNRTSEAAGTPHFTGTVWTEDGGPPARLHAARLTFAPGGRGIRVAAEDGGGC